MSTTYPTPAPVRGFLKVTDMQIRIIAGACDTPGSWAIGPQDPHFKTYRSLAHVIALRFKALHKNDDRATSRIRLWPHEIHAILNFIARMSFPSDPYTASAFRDLVLQLDSQK